MSSVNKVFLVGNLVKDVELRSTQSNTSVGTISLATNERYKDSSGEWKDKAEYHRVVVWGKQADNCSQYLSKGSKVCVEGSLQTNKWQDKQGNDRYTTEIKAHKVTFLDFKAASQPANKPVSNGPVSNADEVDDDLPF